MGIMNNLDFLPDKDSKLLDLLFKDKKFLKKNLVGDHITKNYQKIRFFGKWLISARCQYQFPDAKYNFVGKDISFDFFINTYFGKFTWGHITRFCLFFDYFFYYWFSKYIHLWIFLNYSSIERGESVLSDGEIKNGR